MTILLKDIWEIERSSDYKAPIERGPRFVLGEHRTSSVSTEHRLARVLRLILRSTGLECLSEVAPEAVWTRALAISRMPPI